MSTSSESISLGYLVNGPTFMKCCAAMVIILSQQVRLRYKQTMLAAKRKRFSRVMIDGSTDVKNGHWSRLAGSVIYKSSAMSFDRRPGVEVYFHRLARTLMHMDGRAGSLPPPLRSPQLGGNHLHYLRERKFLCVLVRVCILDGILVQEILSIRFRPMPKQPDLIYLCRWDEIMYRSVYTCTCAKKASPGGRSNAGVAVEWLNGSAYGKGNLTSYQPAVDTCVGRRCFSFCTHTHARVHLEVVFTTGLRGGGSPQSPEKSPQRWNSSAGSSPHQ
ncbi:hypothetical protein ZHAS_00020020 [Anopheles sinensis]|uniref:Uncharacterized protein n=1 Tax=Anopheles sinensis TaxID=74873 RepID=A0A084WNS0_ANOSI|nr:hypothetical protein ZHAS_00020020 [Anopheles sinensis]